MSRALSRISAALAAACWLGACSTVDVTPVTGYKPVETGLLGLMAPYPTGYESEQLDAHRFRITATGTSVTPAERVDAIALRRAAETARDAGAPRFGILALQRTTVCERTSMPIYSPEGIYLTSTTQRYTLPRTVLTIQPLYDAVAEAAHADKRYQRIAASNAALAEADITLNRTTSKAEKEAALRSNRLSCLGSGIFE